MCAALCGARLLGRDNQRAYVGRHRAITAPPAALAEAVFLFENRSPREPIPLSNSPLLTGLKRLMPWDREGFSGVELWAFLDLIAKGQSRGRGERKSRPTPVESLTRRS